MTSDRIEQALQMPGGAISGPLIELDVRTLPLGDLTLFGCTAFGKEVFANFVMRIENTKLTALVAKNFPLHELADAQK